jgi:hypothetical protein
VIIAFLFTLKCFFVYYINKNTSLSRMVANQCEYSMGLFVAIVLCTLLYAIGGSSFGNANHLDILDSLFRDGVWIALIILITEMIIAIYASTLIHVVSTMIRKKNLSNVGKYGLIRQVTFSMMLVIYALGISIYFSLR